MNETYQLFCSLVDTYAKMALSLPVPPTRFVDQMHKARTIQQRYLLRRRRFKPLTD